ncbi:MULTISPECIES: hypothetical protein [unclassified Stenotrophomonas]|uniref:hypothetical protein n=1 Tax=unclassified Stenotrophomonas TaxID=196198 RepID=UPI0015E6F310|nr:MULTISPECIES: hypothetical protein [unclassified Stenotrophomonas]
MSNKVEYVKPIARELARELTQEEIELVAGGGGTLPGTIAFDQIYDNGDHWLKP